MKSSGDLMVQYGWDVGSRDDWFFASVVQTGFETFYGRAEIGK
jgi:hypothetical protein